MGVSATITYSCDYPNCKESFTGAAAEADAAGWVFSPPAYGVNSSPPAQILHCPTHKAS